jgi:hypothetical protein
MLREVVHMLRKVVHMLLEVAGMLPAQLQPAYHEQLCVPAALERILGPSAQQGALH